MSDIVLANQDIVKVDRKIQTDIFNYSSSEFFINMKESDIPPKGHPDRGDFINREREKCRTGLTVGGVYIPGNLYFHFNHFYLIGDDEEDESGRTINRVKVATLRDNDWIIHTEYAKAVREKKGYCLASSRQIGKDLLNSSILYQKDREITIGEVKVGDEIYGDDGKLTKVIGVYPQGVKPVYKITMLDGREIFAGEEHNWYVYDIYKHKYLVKTTKELLVDYKMYRESWKHRNNSFAWRYSIDLCKPVEYEEKKLLIDPYMLGLWLSDGNKSNFSITNMDEEIEKSIYDYGKIVNSDIYKYHNDKRPSKVCTYSFRFKKDYKRKRYEKHCLNKWLDYYNLRYNKHIPFEYLHSSYEQRLELLKGILDGDGYCGNGSVSFSNTNEKIVKGVEFLVRSLGMGCKTVVKNKTFTYKGIKKQGKPAYEIQIFTDIPVFKLTRKKERQSVSKFSKRIAIKNIEYVFDDETTCIEVDNDSHLFLTNDFTVTHNTTCLTALTLREVSLYENAEAMLIFGSLQDKQSFTKKIKVAIEHGQPFIVRTPIDKDWGNKTEIRFGYTNKDNTTVEKARIFLYNVDGGSDSEKGAGKALVHGSKVYYEDKVGNIEDCKIGDRIFGADGKLTTITGVYPQGIVELFKITFKDGRVVTCCENHLWTVSTNLYNFQTVDTKHLLNLISVNKIYLPKIKYTNKLKALSKKLGISIFKNHPEIQSIEKVNSNYATCISVDNKDKLFLTDNFVPTHNTISLFAMDEALKHGSKVYYQDREDVIENVKVGDKIYGRDGKLTTVLEVRPQGITDIYKITLKDGRTVEASPNHLWEVVNKNHNKQVLTTEQLFIKKTKHNPFYIPLNEAVEYPEKQFIVDPYILGYHMGDGDTKGGRFCSTELDIVEKYKKFYEVTDMKDNLHYYARNLVKDLKKINVYGNKHIPEEYFYGSIKQRRELLSALLDSDGGVTTCNNATTGGVKTIRIIFTNKNLKLAEAVKRLSYSLGYSCKLHSKDNYSYDRKTKEKLPRGIVYYVEIFTKENLFFTKVKSDKVNNNKLNRNYFKNISILSIEKVEKDYSTCIKVDNQDSLFLTNDFIVTHNCGKYPFQASWEAVEPALKGKNGYRSAPYFSWTGGDTEKAKEAFKFTLNPEASNLLEFETEGKKTAKVMFATYRQDCKIQIPFTEFLKNEKIPFDKTNKDLQKLKIEVSDVEKATQKTLKELEDKKKDKDPLASIKHRAYYPLCLKDILAKETKNNFNKEFIDQQLEYLKDVGYDKVEVFRDIKTGEIKHKFSSAPVIEDWRKPVYLDAPVKIWDFPKHTDFGVHVIGCLPPNEKVLTQKGLLNIEEVTLNDKLVNEDGNYVNIINLQKYYVKDEDLFEIGVNGSQRLTRFTGEHPILVSEDKTRYVSIDKRKREGLKQRYKDFNFTYKKISDIKVGDWVKIPNIYKKEIEIDFDILWDEINCGNCNKLNNPLKDKDFWWLVGLWLGDGWLDKQRVSFTFNKNEVYYIEKFKTVVKKLFDKEYTSVKQGKGCIELYISSVKLNLFLNKHFGKYAQGKFISEWVKYLNPEFKKELIRGYLNSDGNVSINKKQHFVLNFVSINLGLLEGFQDIFYSLGYTCGISLLRNESEHTFNDIKCKTKKCYSLSLFNSNAIKFLEDIFDEKDHKISKVVLKRDYTSQGIKKYFFSDDLEFIYLKIKTLNVTKYTGWVHNFECDTHTYMCHRITTHNCDGYRENETLSSDSLGYFTVLRRLHSDLEDPFRGKQVASWLGRKKTVKDMLQLLLDVAEWYNAQILYEHVDRSVLDFFESKRKLHLLIDTVPLQKEISIKTKTKNNKGLRATVANKQFLLNSTLGWVNEELEDESLGYSRINDEVLLNQLAEYDPDENLDCYIGFSHAVVAYNYFEKFGVPQVEDSNKKQITSNKKPLIYNAFGIPYTKKNKNAFGF